MKSLPLLNYILVLFVGSLSAESLFNGKNLDGWDIVVEDGWEDYDGASLFQVEDGMIHVYPVQNVETKQPFGGIVTENSYGQFHLSLEYRWGEKKFAPRDGSVRDAGIIFHIDGTVSIWPAGVECQIQEGDTGDMWIIGNTRASSPVHSVTKAYSDVGDLETRGAGLDGDRFPRGYCWEQVGWNRVDVIVDGDSAVFKVNGHTVNEVHKMRTNEDVKNDWGWQALTEGKILLQAEGAELFYRNIEIKPLE